MTFTFSFVIPVADTSTSTSVLLPFITVGEEIIDLIAISISDSSDPTPIIWIGFNFPKLLLGIL